MGVEEEKRPSQMKSFLSLCRAVGGSLSGLISDLLALKSVERRPGCKFRLIFLKTKKKKKKAYKPSALSIGDKV